MADANNVEIGLRLPVELQAVLEDWHDGGGPLYQRLASSLGAGITRGHLLLGSRLPPERDLAVRLGVGRSVVAGAYEVLRRQGLVERRQGRGTEVTGVRAGVGANRRSTQLTTLLQRNVVFRNLGEPTVDTIDLVSSTGPTGIVRDSIAEAIDALDVSTLLCDQGYVPLGYPPLRRAVATHLTARGVPTTEDEVLVTGGAQQAITLIATHYVSPNELVVVEDPTYPGAIDAFRTAGARILPVPVVDDVGVNLEVLAATLERNAVRAAYLIPAFHNPTGSLLSEEARREVARIGDRLRIPIIEDEALADLAIDLDPPRPIAALSPNGSVITVGSLSKLAWGGLRVGWIRAPRGTIRQLGRLKASADLGCSLLSQAVATELLARVATIRSARRLELRMRRARLTQLLTELLPTWSWTMPKGGLSMWACLPAGSSSEFSRVALGKGVSIVPGSAMSVIGAFDDHVRISFDEHPQVLDEGLQRLAEAWQIYARVGEESGSCDLKIIA